MAHIKKKKKEKKKRNTYFSRLPWALQPCFHTWTFWDSARVGHRMG